MSSRNTKNLLSSFSSYSSSSLKTMHSDAISAILITTDGRFLRCNQATQRSSRRCPEEGRSGDFWKLVTGLLKSEKLNVYKTQTFFQEAYTKLDESKKAQVDLATLNIADLLRHIADFYLSKKTPDESPQLMTMIDQLLQMKKRVE